METRNIVSTLSIQVFGFKLTRSLPGLESAAERFDIDTITQRGLDALRTETEREYQLGAMVHCAGGDSEITLRVFVAVILERIQELDEMDGGSRTIRDDFCFLGLDL